MKLLVLAGDGIGPEITAASDRLRLGLIFEHEAMGHAGIEHHGHALHDKVHMRARDANGVVMGPYRIGIRAGNC